MINSHLIKIQPRFRRIVSSIKYREQEKIKRRQAYSIKTMKHSILRTVVVVVVSLAVVATVSADAAAFGDQADAMQNENAAGKFLLCCVVLCCVLFYE